MTHHRPFTGRRLPAGLLRGVVWLLVMGISGLAWREARSPKAPERYKMRTVVIDAGHGGKDPGCHGKAHDEKKITLAIALELGKMIKAGMPDLKVIYTRKTDVFVELNERAALANRNAADLFISIHCNAGGRHVQGTETYVMGMHTSEGNLDVAKRENSAILLEKDYLQKYSGFDPSSPLAHIFFSNVQSAYLANSLRFATHVEEHFEKRGPSRPSRGVRQAGFLVLWKTAMPSALIETGYLTHPGEEKYLGTLAGQTEVARSIYQALKQYRAELEAATPSGPSASTAATQ